MMIVIRKATEKDIPAIQQLAVVIWEKTYSSIISQEQIRYMLDLFYSEKSLLKQMNELEHFFFIALENEIEIGFASFSEVIGQLETNYGLIFKLHKIYVHPNQQGKGTGKLLIEFIMKEIGVLCGWRDANHDSASLDLNVNRFNPARFFYEKLGFQIIREEDIDIGNGYFMNDYVMRKEV